MGLDRGRTLARSTAPQQCSSQGKQGCAGAALHPDGKTQIKIVNPAGSSLAMTTTFLIPGGVYYFFSFKGSEHLYIL